MVEGVVDTPVEIACGEDDCRAHAPAPLRGTPGDRVGKTLRQRIAVGSRPPTAVYDPSAFVHHVFKDTGEDLAINVRPHAYRHDARVRGRSDLDEHFDRNAIFDSLRQIRSLCSGTKVPMCPNSDGMAGLDEP